MKFTLSIDDKAFPYMIVDNFYDTQEQKLIWKEINFLKVHFRVDNKTGSYGVAHDENTGSTKWLILDPHYSGCDDLSNIQTKSYMLEGYRAIPCSWRGLDAFSGRSSYNLYLPQRPRGV